MSAIRAPGLGRGSISALIRHANAHSLPLSLCLAETKLKHNFNKLVEDPTPEQEIMLIENLIREQGQPFRNGFAVGLNYEVGDLGVLGLALMSSKDATHAAEIGVRYLNLAFNFTQFSLQQEDGKLTMTWHITKNYSEPVRQFLIARDMGIIHFLYRHLNSESDTLFFHKVGVSFDYLAGMDDASKAFGCGVHYNQDSTYIMSELIYLQAVPPFSNPINAQIIEDTYFRNLNKHEVSLTQKIKQTLIMGSSTNIQKNDIANQYHLSERTLSRRLKDEGTHWRRLLSEARIEKAELLLKNSNDSIQSVCEQVGFANLSSFCHAFQKGNTMTPTEYRRKIAKKLV